MSILTSLDDDVRYYESHLKQAIEKRRIALEVLPEEILSREFYTSNLWGTQADHLELSLSAESPEGAQNLIEEFQNQYRLALNPKIEYSGYKDKFQRSGVAIFGDYEVDVVIHNLPKPPKCRLVEHKETVTEEKIYYTAECEDQEAQ